MKKVVSVENMRLSDKGKIESGRTEAQLMLDAAQGIFDRLKNHLCFDSRVAVVTGSGNNGGDGYALSVLLSDFGIKTTIYSVANVRSETTRYYAERCKERGIGVITFDEGVDFLSFDIIIDCMTGTGFKGELLGLYALAAERINESRAFVVSVDINSGLNGDNGLTKLAVKSKLTLAIGDFKVGNIINQAKDYAEKTEVVDIGIPILGKPYYLTEAEDFKDIFAKRKEFSHKGSFGRVGVFGGCSSYFGALRLAANATAPLLSGCGLSKIILPSCLCEYLYPIIKECTVFPFPSDETGHFAYNPAAIKEAVSGLDVLALGMGMGRTEANKRIVEELLTSFSGDVILDADGLFSIVDNLQALENAKARVILTPHIAEFSRLTGYSVEKIVQNPISLARAFAEKYSVTLLLKGTVTIITDGTDVLLSDEGTVGMSKGGSGDVLSGIIAGVSAFSHEKPIMNAACGAFLAGRAASLAVRDKNVFSTLPSDTIEHIYEAINEIINV